MDQVQHSSGHHECEIFTGSQLEAAESEYNWKTCEKNPEHKHFVSAQHFIDNSLWKLQSATKQEKLKAWIDLTVRLRVMHTSMDRQKRSDFCNLKANGGLRVGTGCISGVSVPVYNSSCPCCGQIKEKHWKFEVYTALHVVFNTEEARCTKVDLFYDDANSQQNGLMKSVWGMEAVELRPFSDGCKMLCVTCDQDVGERIESAWLWMLDGTPFSQLTRQDLSDIDLLRYVDEGCVPVLIISHPHAQPKQITVGELRYTDGENPLREYTTPTCPGSSGAPVFEFDGYLEHAVHYFGLYSPIHNGSYGSTSTDRMFNKVRGHKKSAYQINFGHTWY